MRREELELEEQMRKQAHEEVTSSQINNVTKTQAKNQKEEFDILMKDTIKETLYQMRE